MLTFSITDKTGREYPVTLFYPDTASRDIVFLHTAADESEKVWELLPDPKPILAVIGGIDWNGDLSPWSSPAVFRGTPDFAGGADQYLDALTDRIVPAVVSAVCEMSSEAMTASAASFRLTLAGYSLAGLFAAYAPYRTAVFSRIASMSGSLWFDGFADFAERSEMISPPEKAYFSLGDCEARTKNPRMAKVASCTDAVAETFRSRGIQTVTVSESGGHFSDVPARIARGIASVLE